ncbi:MAG: hypothetical protein GY864_15800 [Desulfobacterales bacterium]|nr:hypothetical protein [Desulfobacterales bacterium]
METKRKKHIFDLIGGGILIFWLLMVGLLVKKNNADYHGEETQFTDSISHIKSSQRDWMEIFLNNKKVGYSMSQVSPLKDDYLIQEKILLRLNLMGQTTSIETVSRAIVDSKFSLKNFRFSMTSGLVSFRVSGRVEGDRILVKVGERAAQREESIKISGPPVISSGMSLFFKGRMLEQGQSFAFPVFDPSTMAQKEIVIRVAGQEPLVINGLEYAAFRLEAEMWGQDITFWLDKDGNVLKERGFMGFTLIRSGAASASRDIDGSGGQDFYELAAVSVKGKLNRPAGLTFLKLKVEGLDGTPFDVGILSLGRQKYASGMIEIVKEESLIKADYSLPYPDYSGEMRLFLYPELHIESDDKAIVETAREITKGIKDPALAARRLLIWVNTNVKKKPVVNVPSALEVLKTRVGDCNEHAVLLTALLRSSGIPARLCAGLVYARGQFFYHAWVESYMGTWITMDPILNQMPADVTHIKLIQGGLDRQVDIIGLLGKLSLEVVGYGYKR